MCAEAVERPPHNMSANTDAHGVLAAPRPFRGRRFTFTLARSK